VTREGKRIRTEHLDVRAAASPLHHPRVGFIVPKHKQSGVARNRLKRRLREIARTRLLPSLPPADVVVRARPEAYGASFDALADELARAAAKLPRVLGR
jgi:ribonuclease P protein component